MYLWHIVYNKLEKLRMCSIVVNCFQNVSLAYRLQSNANGLQRHLRCELLSKCIFGISFTMNRFAVSSYQLLWIAFKMYLWHIVYNCYPPQYQATLVVNCFQNVSLAYRLQCCAISVLPMFRCELLSKCIFGISFTIGRAYARRFATLWIAFKMYLWHIVYNRPTMWTTLYSVVNCFQNVSLAYRLQSCHGRLIREHRLWIAFKMYLWHIVYN